MTRWIRWTEDYHHRRAAIAEKYRRYVVAASVGYASGAGIAILLLLIFGYVMTGRPFRFPADFVILSASAAMFGIFRLTAERWLWRDIAFSSHEVCTQFFVLRRRYRFKNGVTIRTACCEGDYYRVEFVDRQSQKLVLVAGATEQIVQLLLDGLEKR